MYLSHYNLAQKPFQISPNPEFLWLGEKHKEALAMMEYGILNNQGFLVLTGDVGTGKTTLINALVNKLGVDILVATIFNPRLDKLEFFYDLATKFNIDRNFKNKIDFIERFSVFLQRAYKNNKRVLLVIDEAQNLSNELLEEIRLLSNIEEQERKLINIFFVGQNEFNDILMKKECRPLRQRITITSNIKSLTQTETREYITHRLKIAGCDQELFTNKAIREIHSCTRGYPRLINIICDQALLTAYVKDINSIKPSMIRECVRELRLPNEADDDGREKIAAVTSKRKFTLSRALLYASLLGAVTLNGYLLTSISRDQYIGNFKAYYGQLWEKLDISSIPKALRKREVRGPMLAKSKTSPKRGFEKESKQISNHVKKQESQLNKERVNALHRGGQSAIKSSSTKEELVKTSLAKADALPLRVHDHDSGVRSKVVNKEEGLARTGKSNSSGDNKEVFSFGDSNLIIPFNYNSNEIPTQSYESLERIADIMTRHQDIEISVKGHTDSLGSSDYNHKLAAFRANIVKSFLVGKGIDPGRIRAIGVGEKNPFRSNKTVAGRRANRRVVIEVAPHESQKQHEKQSL